MNTVATGMFPLFAANFFDKDEDVPVLDQPSTTRAIQPPPSSLATSSGIPLAPRGSSLRVLDLQTLPRDDGPPTELRTRKEKLAHYEQQCSHVGDCLYVGGEWVAKKRDVLHASRITHVVNCVGFLYPPYFEDEFAYQTLYLQDTPGEDILSVLYDVFDFIEAAREGRVLIHCSQGVSRSTTLAIAYRMWREGRSYEDVFAEVKGMRGVANPNIGFICQLLQWHKRRTEDANAPRLYRVASQSPSAPQYLVPKLAATRPAALDPRGAFVLHAGRRVFIWTGTECPETFSIAAQRIAAQLHKYEGAEAPAVMVSQGEEPDGFWVAMAQGAGAHGGAGTPPPLSPDTDAIGGPSRVRAYDRDFDLYARSLQPPGGSGGPGDSCDSARSGRKTPRDVPEHAASPNDRLRKQARSEAIERERERSARSSGSSYGIGTESARSKALEFQEMAVRRHSMPSPSPRVPRLALPPLGLSSVSGNIGGGSVSGTTTAAAHAVPVVLGTTRDSEPSTISDEEESSDSDGSAREEGAEEAEAEAVVSPAAAAAPVAARPAGVPRLKLG